MALVLTADKYDGPIHLLVGDHHIKIDVVGCKGQQARLAITADDDVEIQRDVIYKKIYGDKDEH